MAMRGDNTPYVFFSTQESYKIYVSMDSWIHVDVYEFTLHTCSILQIERKISLHLTTVLVLGNIILCTETSKYNSVQLNA